ncbi:hypothetical protein GL50803_0013504 [Giardia duodenalis]|uniref:Uncharacterized protein n=1 Tax=Giardia intestinalis (strain ATCC 50803 / WB clone C6) TaxID=184922 RepID=D3KGJ8_GIAIC|nr:hypothetical protein GL50803_0013504 [Giardia intestinalis]KAE8305342.1 hypothetical protein GL50803_0013504 [Giardia intestinalis]
MPPQGSVYPAQVFYSGQRRPYSAVCIASFFSIIDVAVVETIISLPIRNVSTLLCDINCSELLRLHITGHGTVVLYSLYRDAILSAIFTSLRRDQDAAQGITASLPFSVSDDLLSYNMMIQATRPIGLRPSVLVRGLGSRARPREALTAGYLPPCPCKVSVTPFGLQISDTEQAEVLCVPHNAITAVNLDDGACSVVVSSTSNEDGCNLILYGLSPFITEFVYVLLRAYPRFIQIQPGAEDCEDQNALFDEEECVAEKAALCSFVSNPGEHQSIVSSDVVMVATTPALFESLTSHTKLPNLTLAADEVVRGDQLKDISSRATNSLQAFAQIESLFDKIHSRENVVSGASSNQLSPPHTPDQPAVQHSQITAPLRMPRTGASQDLSSIPTDKAQSSTYFYKHLERVYVPAVIARSQPLASSTLSVSITTSEVAYTVVVDRAFQGFDSASRFIRTCSSQSLRNASNILDTARAEYLQNQSMYASLEPIVLLSEAHTPGIIPVLLGLKEAQSICLQSSMRLVSATIPACRT